MNRGMGRYRIYLIDGTEVETGLCKLRVSIKEGGDFLFQEDPSTYGEGIQRTFVMANVKYWEPML